MFIYAIIPDLLIVKYFSLPSSQNSLDRLMNSLSYQHVYGPNVNTDNIYINALQVQAFRRVMDFALCADSKEFDL